MKSVGSLSGGVITGWPDHRFRIPSSSNVNQNEVNGSYVVVDRSKVISDVYYI
jgi:hypothetical protein